MERLIFTADDRGSSEANGASAEAECTAVLQLPRKHRKEAVQNREGFYSNNIEYIKGPGITQTGHFHIVSV